MIEPMVEVTRYEVSCLPLDHLERPSFTVNVEYRGYGKWAVKKAPWCYDADGERDYESVPCERTDEWLARYRHDLDDALRIAREVAPGLKNGRWTVADALEHGDDE